MFEESTPTVEVWNLLRTSYKAHVKRLWKSKNERTSPVLIRVPPMVRRDPRLKSCVSNCIDLIDANENCEIRFGLKVFVAKGGDDVIGIKAVVHAVVYDNDTERYTDPSPEEDENKIMFIHIPNMFSPEQKTLILSNPRRVRMGSIIIGLKEPSVYEQVVRMNPQDNYFGRHCATDLELFLVNEDHALLRVEEDGKLVEMEMK